MSETLGTAVEVLQHNVNPVNRDAQLALGLAEAQAILDVLPDFLFDADGKPQDWLVPCAHCERGNLVSLHPGGTVWANGKRLKTPSEDDYFKSYGEVVHELTEANKRMAAMRESLHQSLHPQTTDDSCRYCEKDWPL